MNKQKKKKKKKKKFLFFFFFFFCVGRHFIYWAIGFFKKKKKKKKKKKHFVSSLFLSLVHISSILGQAWAEGKGEHATSRLERPADVKPGENVRRHDL